MARYLITFLEGIISFISPCMLALLPLYLSYFAGGAHAGRLIWLRAISFVIGFSSVFCLMGVFAGVLGSYLIEYRPIVNVVCGGCVALFGVSYLGFFSLPFFKGIREHPDATTTMGAFLFGIVYAVNLTPCVGTFLGSAFLLASTAGTAIRGGLLLLVYSMGLGIPFVLCAFLAGRLDTSFAFMKRHHEGITKGCGVFLIVVGILMMFGLGDRITGLLW